MLCLAVLRTTSTWVQVKVCSTLTEYRLWWQDLWVKGISETSRVVNCSRSAVVSRYIRWLHHVKHIVEDNVLVGQGSLMAEGIGDYTYLFAQMDVLLWLKLPTNIIVTMHGVHRNTLFHIHTLLSMRQLSRLFNLPSLLSIVLGRPELCLLWDRCFVYNHLWYVLITERGIRRKVFELI